MRECTFIDFTARTTRSTELPNADFDTGMNNGSCMPGIGITTGPTNLLGTPNQFTLLDQNELTRTPQNGQSIGGVGLNAGSTAVQPFQIIQNDQAGDGGVGEVGGATLATLAAGWTAVLPP